MPDSELPHLYFRHRLESGRVIQIIVVPRAGQAPYIVSDSPADLTEGEANETLLWRHSVVSEAMLDAIPHHELAAL